MRPSATLGGATAWLGDRSPRERRLLGIAGAVAVGAAALGGIQAAREDLAALGARVAGHERELGEVRRLAAVLRRDQTAGVGAAADAPSLLSRLEAAAEATVGRERIASMTPAAGADQVALRLAGVSLADLVRLLHALEAGPPPLAIARLALRKYPDDPGRFDVTLEVAP